MARDGFGDMAVSNAIGSNVFDINLGLGFPFLLRILIEAGNPMMLLDTEEQVGKRWTLKSYCSEFSWLIKVSGTDTVED